MTKALVLFSWWLDSLLAVKILEDQWIDTTAIIFTTPFFWATKAKEIAKKENIHLRIENISEIHLQMLKNPKYWYGKNMNPCIDCHWLMVQKACEIAEKEGFDIVASWEVLWQRPMSQTTNWLNSVTKVSGKEILRPLSAKLLNETSYETRGLVDRSRLFDISGRWRHRQLELTKQFWLKDFEMPGWWCLLTQEWYSEKLKSLFDNFMNDILSIDTEIIKYWRLKIFSRWYAVMWRDDSDNEKLLELKPQSDKYKALWLVQTTWPLVLIKIITQWYNQTDIMDFYKEKVKKLQNFNDFSLQNI